MTKNRFLSVFETFALRKRGCDRKSAKAYADYIRAINSRAMKLGCPDYLEWISECSNLYSIKNDIRQLENSISSITVVSTMSNYKSALGLLDQFIDEIFCDKPVWPQFGKDEKTIDRICYHPKVAIDERVPNLCVDLKNEYIRIVDFAKHVFGDLFDDDVYTFIPVTLNPDKPVAIYRAKKEYIDKLSEKREKRQDTTEQEDGILKRRTINCSILAKFNRVGYPNIEIFYRNTESNTHSDYLSTLKNCLAHEYMHYLHACYCDKIGNDSTFNYEKISEGIADFFAMLFTLYRGSYSDCLFAEKKYLTWAKMFDSGWPYADALYMFKTKGTENFYTEQVWDFKYNDCIEKLMDVLKNSPNFADAYKVFKS